MDKFSNYKKKDIKNNKKDVEIIYDSDILKVIPYKDRDVYKTIDFVSILPYFIEDGCFFLQHKEVINYEYILKDTIDFRNIKQFITVMKHPLINDNPTLSVRHCLSNYGIILGDLYDLKPITTLFIDENQTGKYYLYLLELYSKDYRIIKSDKNDIVKIDFSNIDDLRVIDIVTDYLITKLKIEIKI
jgi:hypothetical protein